MQKDNRSSNVGAPKIPLTAADQKRARTNLQNRLNLTCLYEQAEPLESHLFTSASCLWEFFHNNGYKIDRGAWIAKSSSDNLLRHMGWVYAFYGANDFPLYVGETGRSLRKRFFEHENRRSKWWSQWVAVKVLPCPQKSMRKFFESLLGVAGGYTANTLQPPGEDNLLDDVILSLLLLGNDNNNRLPIFPALPE